MFHLNDGEDNDDV